MYTYFETDLDGLKLHRGREEALIRMCTGATQVAQLQKYPAEFRLGPEFLSCEVLFYSRKPLETTPNYGTCLGGGEGTEHPTPAMPATLSPFDGRHTCRSPPQS